jgi:hypothetical protein
VSTSQPSQIAKAGIFPVAILILTLLNLSALVADTILVLPKEVTSLIHAIDTAVCGVFFLDFMIQFYRAESKVGFLKWVGSTYLPAFPTSIFCAGDGLSAFCESFGSSGVCDHSKRF